jgi:hypothetical protein
VNSKGGKLLRLLSQLRPRIRPQDSPDDPSHFFHPTAKFPSATSQARLNGVPRQRSMYVIVYDCTLSLCVHLYCAGAFLRTKICVKCKVHPVLVINIITTDNK